MKNKFTSVVKWIFSNIYIKISITFILIGYILNFILQNNWHQILHNIKIKYLPVLFLLIIIFWVLNILSLYVMILPIKKIKIFRFAQFQLPSLAMGAFTPSQVGELSIIVLMKNIAPKQKVTAAVILNKIVNIFIILLTGSFFFLLTHRFYYFIIFLSSFFFLLVIFTIILKSHSEKIKEKIVKKYFKKYLIFFKSFSDFFKIHKYYFFANIGLNLLKVIIAGFSIFSVFLIFQIQINYFLLLTIFSLNRIVALIPITISGIGLLEGGVIFTLSQFQNIPIDQASLAMVFLRIVNILFALFIALLFLWNKNKNKSISTK